MASTKPTYSPGPFDVPVAAMTRFLQSVGIPCGADDTAVRSLLDTMQASSPGYVSTRSVLAVPVADNVVTRALLSRLAIPDFAEFVTSLQTIYEEVKVGVCECGRSQAPD